MIKNEKGQAVVEFVLVLPLFFILIFGAIDYGFALHKKHLLTQLSRELAIASSTIPDPKDVKKIEGELITGYFNTETVTITYTPALADRQQGKRIKVDAAYTYEPFTPGLGLIGTMNLVSNSGILVEINTALK